MLGANAVSETGNVLAFVTIPWFVLQTTGSAARTGLAGGAFLLAAVVAGVAGGPVVDRLGFKRTSIVADLAGAVTVALIPLLYHTVGLSFWQLLVLVSAIVFMGLPFWVLVAAPQLGVAMGALFVAGFALGPPNPLTYSVLQERTPPRMLGRVLGASVSLSMVAAPIGLVLCGYALENVGLRLTLAGISACYLAVGLLSFLTPALRELDKPRE